MKTTQKISFRGSLADDVAKRIRSSAKDTSIGAMLNEFLQSEPGEFIVTHEKDMLIVGRKSDVGKYLPDW